MKPVLALLLLVTCLAGCSNHGNLAPVEERVWHPHNRFQSTHIVKRGETLYAIAFGYDRDYRQLAAYNHLRSPYALRVGQVLRIQGAARRSSYRKPLQKLQGSRIAARPVLKRSTYVAVRPVYNSHTGSWLWPARGKVVANFFPQQGKKGIDIAGKKGETVHAAAAGVVAYAGSGLNGYGNLIIIKHEGQFMTAYGNNQRNSVVEGQKVKAGQVIAEMGIVDRRFWGVHFEIRKAGQPVNPLGYLRTG